MRVIFLHHAGGDQYSWRRYQDALSPEIEKIYLELPGRGDRFSEPLLKDTAAMVEELYQQILPHLQSPYILVGKSMGALHTYLLLHRIKDEEKAMPLHVFLGSRKCPASYSSHIKIALVDSENFWKGVQSYGGCPAALLEHKELMELYEPILRADFESLENYQYLPQEPIPVSATIMTGKSDLIQLEETKSWQDHFSGDVQFLELLGGHFFMHEQAYTISKMIEEQFANAAFLEIASH